MEIIAKRTKKKQPEELTILTLQAGIASEFWGIIMQIAQANIVLLEKQIISKIDEETKKSLSDLEIDRLRDKRGYLIELTKTPENYIELLRKKGNVAPTNFDPYYTDPKDIIADRRKKNIKN